MTDARTKVPLVTAALVVGVIVAQAFVLTIYDFIVDLTVYSGDAGFAAPNIVTALGGTTLQLLLRAVFFGVGVFVSLRFVAPIGADDLWRKVILRGLIATAIGALSALVFGFIVSVIAAIGPNSDFFGYAFNVQFKNGGPNIVNVLEGALTPLVAFFPLVVLAAILQRLWLSRPPKYT